MTEVVLAVVAHPDDEILGAGGTLARYVELGHKVHIAFVADGVTSREADQDALHRRTKAAENAACIIGAETPTHFGYPDNRLDGVDLLDLVQTIERFVNEVGPTTIFTHHCGDLNIDHEICHRAVLTACRPLPQSTVRRIFTMEIVSSTEWSWPSATRAFMPVHFVDISTTLEKKRRALEAYGEEMRAFPHARSYETIDALARWRGASVGLHAAEAFGIVRAIEG